MISNFVDQDLGEIKIITSKRAKRCIARRRNDRIEMTIPYGYSQKQVFEVFEKLKPKIINLPEPNKIKFTPDSCFKTCTFEVKISIQAVNHFYATLRSGILSIVCPYGAGFEKADTQQLISSYIEAAMKAEAKRFLPQRVKELASKNNFVYTVVKINKSKTRWGSCSVKKNINLSYYCMLLPEYLIDFIVLHELCHTKEMNHGAGFWSILNSVTNNRAKEFTSDLRSYLTYW